MILLARIAFRLDVPVSCCVTVGYEGLPMQHINKAKIRCGIGRGLNCEEQSQ